MLSDVGLEPDARADSLFALFGWYFRQFGPTVVELTILGGTGYVTMDPENVETLLSTRFDGTTLYIHVFTRKV